MYEPCNYPVGEPPKKEVVPIKENIGKAEIVVTYIKKCIVDDKVVDRVCGIKTTLTGYIEYNSTYNSRYVVKPVSKKLEMVFHPFDKSFNVDFIKLPLGDGRYKFISKAAIVSVDVQISEEIIEVDQSRIKGQFGC